MRCLNNITPNDIHGGSMLAYRVKNVRSIHDSDFIYLKRISLFLGANSTGKSSMLRILPLLRQSSERSDSSHILLNGHLVDFGDMKEIVTKDSGQGCFLLAFKIPTSRLPKAFAHNKLSQSIGCIDVEVSVSKVDEFRSDVSHIKLSFCDVSFTISFSARNRVSSVKVNNIDVSLDYSNVGVIPGIVPYITYKPSSDVGYVPYYDRMRKVSDAIMDYGVSKFKEYIPGKIHKNTLRDICYKVQVGSMRTMLESMLATSKDLSSVRKKVKEWSVDSEEWKNVACGVIASRIPHLLQFINQTIEQYARSVQYINPIRAKAERYYRIQGLSSERVDSRGENIYAVLYSIQKSKGDDFREWTMRNFGFSVKVRVIEGHTIVEVSEDNNNFNNLADCGFGYSQILPLVVLIWQLQNKRSPQRVPVSTVVAIEQPELHLHPKMQARLADVIAYMSSYLAEKNVDVRFVIETHSDVIVNRLGSHIASQVINNEDITLVLFEKSNSGKTDIRVTGFDSDGYVWDWPVGFLAPGL